MKTIISEPVFVGAFPPGQELCLRDTRTKQKLRGNTMERRDFLKKTGATAGALGIIGGWFGLEKMAEASQPVPAGEPQSGDATDSKCETVSLRSPACRLTERDETWGDVMVHVIEMTLPFDNPAVFFQREGQRLLVPRQNEKEIRYVSGKEEARQEAPEALLRERLEALRSHYVYGTPGAPLTPGEIRRGVVRTPRVPQHEDTNRALLLIAHQPQGTEYGLIYGFDKLTRETMLLTSPASMLFGG